jgi:hypothetical protein
MCNLKNTYKIILTIHITSTGFLKQRYSYVLLFLSVLSLTVLKRYTKLYLLEVLNSNICQDWKQLLQFEYLLTFGMATNTSKRSTFLKIYSLAHTKKLDADFS